MNDSSQEDEVSGFKLLHKEPTLMERLQGYQKQWTEKFKQLWRELDA